MADNITAEVDRDAELRAKLPTQVKEQPDPFLQMTTGKTSVGGAVLFALIAVAILSVVLYGLNSPRDLATPPAPSSSTAQSNSPAAGGQFGAPARTSPQTANNAKG